MKRALKVVEKVEPLTRSERGMFRECESIIKAGRESFFKVGGALQEIRDSRYYREEFATFDEYLAKRWGFNRNYASMMITAAEAGSELLTIVSSSGRSLRIEPERETQVRPLKKLPPVERQAAWSAAVEIAGGCAPTEAQVRQAVRQLNPQPKPTAPAAALANLTAVRRALGVLQSVSNPTKNIKAAIELLNAELDSGAAKTNTKTS